jgi:hypothetical protein
MRRLIWEGWARSARPAMGRFSAALCQPEVAQKQVFAACLRELEGTAFAREHDLDARMGLEAFRRQVPVRNPSEWEPWVGRILRGEHTVLTKSPVERLVPTGGSTGPAKLIPMTAASRREYALAVDLWIGDTLRRHPGVRGGRAYIATSPAISFSVADAAVPVGYAEDAAYLHPVVRRLFQHLLVVPPDVAALREDAWKTRVIALLSQARDLRFLSLWHPGYLQALFEEEDFRRLKTKWSGLKVISCWADGACSDAAERLHRLFPQAVLQRKGLWLTEGVISLPWQGQTPLALLNGFLEFETPGGEVLLAHELEEGMSLRPVLTNHAGLVRVRLGDRIEVDGFLDHTPCIRWMGRADAVSDLCGEKLSDDQVAAALEDAGMPLDACLRANLSSCPPAYDVLTVSPGGDLSALDQALRRNPHYDWARTVGQLGPPRHIQENPPAPTPGKHIKSGRLLLPDLNTLFTGAPVSAPALRRS